MGLVAEVGAGAGREGVGQKSRPERDALAAEEVARLRLAGVARRTDQGDVGTLRPCLDAKLQQLVCEPLERDVTGAV